LQDLLRQPPSAQEKEHCSKIILGINDRRNALLLGHKGNRVYLLLQTFTGVNQAESAFWFSLSVLSPAVKSRISFGRALHYKEAQKSIGHNLLPSLGRS